MADSRDRTPFGARLYQARKAAGLSQTALAKLAGVSQSTLTDAERIATGSTHVASLARVLRVRPEWLSRGEGDMAALGDTRETSNVDAVIDRGGVPLISWVQAGRPQDLMDPQQLSEAEFLPCPVKHGPRAFCLRVRGESMFNPEGRPTYSEGDVIFVDPDMDINHGDRVIVRIDDDAQATFKQYIEEDGSKYLKALNPAWVPRYTPIDGNATICGKVIGTWKPE